MAAGQDLIELKFRLSDGTDIGPHKYSPSTTVQSLKEKILAQWPKEKENGPRTINDLKLINAGKILENNRTLADSRLPVGELPGGLITMHVVVRPPIADKKNEESSFRHKELMVAFSTDKLLNDSPEKPRCSCSIL